MNLNDLYKKVSAIPIGDFPPSALSGLLHGYISVYSIVRVNPWLEDVYGSQWDIHERIREIAGELADLIKDPAVALEDRVGYVADLMETYLTYSDMDFLDIALDAAYGIISPERNGEIVLPCRTPEMCRLLCSCYYFTGEEEYLKLAGEIVEKLERVKYRNISNIWKVYRCLNFYQNIIVTGKNINIYDIHFILNELSLINNSVINSDIQVLCFDVLAMMEYDAC